MNIQDKIVKSIIVIQEAGQGLTREQLQNILAGKETEELQSMELDQLESFGIADGTDEDDWNAIFDRAIEEGLLKIKNQKQHTITYTPNGKKYRKKPYAINLGDGSEEEEYINVSEDELDAVMRIAMNEKQAEAYKHITSERSKRQIKLIQAIDRKIALDDFAENENIDLDEVLDDLEALLQHGKRLDITYFIKEIIDKDDMQEVKESMGDKVTIDRLRKEWGDVYNEEELRLLCYILT
jgi:superfamily II DNA helicase RecQ